MLLTGVVEFINQRKWIAGPCFALFLIFSEVIPLTSTVGDVSKLDLMFSVSYFIAQFPGLNSLPSWVLAVPALTFLAISIVPLTDRKFHLPLFILFVSGFTFYPLLHNYQGEWFAALLWSILLAPVVALNLWIRSIDYFYSMALGLGLMDLGAAVWGYRLGLDAIGVPYHSGLPPALIIVIDSSLIGLVIFLWWKRFDFGRKLKLKWLIALE